MTFTDMLDEYLEAKKELQEARNAYTGYSFGYFHDKIIEREYKAAQALNKAFEEITKEKT